MDWIFERSFINPFLSQYSEVHRTASILFFLFTTVLALNAVCANKKKHSICCKQMYICTRCGSHFENLPSMALPRPHDNASPLPFRFQIALDLSYLEPEGQCQGLKKFPRDVIEGKGSKPLQAPVKNPQKCFLRQMGVALP